MEEFLNKQLLFSFQITHLHFQTHVKHINFLLVYAYMSVIFITYGLV